MRVETRRWPPCELELISFPSLSSAHLPVLIAQSYAPTQEATDKYHKTVTQWYSGLSDEQKTAALSVKGFPKSIVKSPRQVKYAENNGSSQRLTFSARQRWF